MIMLSSGELIDPFNPDPNLLTLDVIAHHLSMQCRYNGACHSFLSVAEHSYIGAMCALPDAKLARAFLFHDAHEAIIGDIISPVKHLLADSPWWHAADALDLVIQERFDVSFDDERITRLDRHMLSWEWRMMFPQDRGRYLGHATTEFNIPSIMCREPDAAKDSFISIAKSLGVKQ